MADATKVGNVYLEIRAEIRRLSKDLADAHNVAKQGAAKIQDSIDKGLNFEKMKAKAVVAGTAVYAAFRMVGQAVESARIGSVLEKQAASFNNLSIAAGTSSKKMIDSLKSASQGLVAESDLMAAAGKAMLMSIPADKINELMKIAAATSKMTGQSITEAFNDITLGVARQSRLILDNLGIIVNVDDANRKYAAALGTTAEALNDAQKRQAFMNAVLEAGADMIKRLGDSKGALDGVNKALAGQKSLWDEINKSTAYFLDDTLAAYGGMLDAITVKLKAMRESAKVSDRNQEQFLINQARMQERLGLRKPGTSSEMQAKFNEKWIGKSEAETADTAAYDRWKAAEKAARDARFIGSQRVADNQIEYDVEGRWKAYEAELKKIEDSAKKAAEEVKRLREEFVKMIEDYAAIANTREMGTEEGRPEYVGAWEAESNAAKAYALNIQNAQKNAEEFEKANEELWKKSITYGEDIIEQEKRKQQIFEDTMNIMSQSFSDAFAGLVMGTKSASDAFNAMTQSIISAMVRMASQKAFEQIFGYITNAISMLGAGETGMGINTVFADGGTMGGYFGMVRHGGGTGSSGGAVRSIPASYFSSAPRYHAGLFPDEQAAILQKGETVIPKGGSVGGDTYNIYQITATDTQSFVDACRRSGAVPLLAAEAINQNGGLRRTIMSRAK